MKDFALSKKDGKFNDIIFDKQQLVIDNETKRFVLVKVLRTIELEEKLLQSLMKLFLTNKKNHVLGFGVEHETLSLEDIIGILSFYNEITDSDALEEQIDLIVEATEENKNFALVLKTKSNKTISLQLGE